MVKIVMTALVSLIGISQFVSAEVININITSSNGPNPNVTLNGTSALAPAPYMGSTWNDLAGSPNGLNLFDSTGNRTTVDIRWGDLERAIDPFSFSRNTPAGLELLSNYFSAHNQFGVPVAPSSILLFGLEPGDLWDIYFISQGNEFQQSGSFSIDSNVLLASGDDLSANDFIEGVNFVKFSGVEANGFGMIMTRFDNNPSGSNFQILNGMQLVRVDPDPDPPSTEPTSVSEPNGMALLLVGLLCLGLTRVPPTKKIRSV